jgi:hypothetical protein
MENIEKSNFSAPNNSQETEGRRSNVYGKERFLSGEAKERVESLVADFKNHYSSLGYREEPSIPISSGVDSTVRFIGSPISVFKPYLIDGQIPDPGIFMRQDCLRTKNLDKLLDDDFSPVWGSFFPNMGAITSPERFEEGCNETFDFFEQRLGISRDNILIRINSTDKDLMGVCKKRFGDNNLEVDSRKFEYYRHKLGIEGMGGRNCNIALRNSGGDGFSDVANLIMIEDRDSKICLEMSIGVSTILKELYGLDHVQDCTPVEGLKSVDEKFRRKFEDAVITCTELFHEGLRPLGQNNRNRILKKYVLSMSYFRAMCDMKIDELKLVISGFEGQQFSASEERISEVLVGFIEAFEKDLLYKNNLSDDQQKIKQALSLLK